MEGGFLEVCKLTLGVGIQVAAEICQRFSDGFGMPVEWALFFNWKSDIRNCNCHTAGNLRVHRMKMVKNMLEKRFCR